MKPIVCEECGTVCESCAALRRDNARLVIAVLAAECKAKDT